MNDRPSILIVDDDEGIRRTLEMILAKKNYQPVSAPDGKTALALVEERFFNLALLDIRLPDLSGTDLLAQLKTRHPDLEALIITGHATLETAIHALSHGAYHYFIKPINVDELLITLDQALDKQSLVIENRQLLQDVQSELNERRHAEHTLQIHAQQQAQVAALGQRALASHITLTELFDEVVALVAQTLRVEFAKVLELSPNDQTLLLRAGVGWQPGLVGRATVSAGLESQAGYTLLSEQPVVVEDLRAEKRFNGPPLLFDHGVVSGMSVIIRGPTQPFGVLGAHTTAHRIFSQGDTDFLQAVANVLAAAIERKRAEQALAAERNLLRTVIDNLPDRVYVKDAACKFVLNNPAHLQALGAKSQEDALGKTDFDFRPRELAERFLADDRKVLESASPLINQEELSPLPSGEPRWLLVTKVPLRDPRGHISGLVGISRDITEHKRAEERVSRIAECFLSFGPDVGENINRLTALCGELLGADCALYNRLDQGLLCSWGQWHAPPGYNPVDQPQGHLCYDVIQHARDQSLVVRHLLETPYAQTDPNVLPYQLQTYIGRVVKLGEEAVGSLCVVYQRDLAPSAEDEQVMGVLASAIAVEEARKHAEAAQRAAETNYRSLFENVPDGVYRSTPDGQILAANPALLRLLGYASLEELMAVDIGAALYVDPAARTAVVAAMMQNGEVRNVEVTLKRKDGRPIVALDNARVVRDLRGNVTYFEGTLTDITERKQRERELLAVAAVSAALRAAPTRAEMLPVILDQAQTLLNADAASIITRDPDDGAAHVEVGCGIWSGGPEFQVPAGKGISGHVFETARPYVTNDLQNDPYYYWRDQIGYLTALAMVPLIVQGSVVGALAIGRVTPIAPEELNVLTAIADITANALHRASLHEKTEQQLQYLVALRTVDQTINASLDLRFTLNILLDQAITQLRVDAAVILLFNPALQSLEYAAGRGFRTKGIERRTWRIGEGYAGTVARERRVVTVRNLAQSTERESAGEGFAAYCGVPLVAKGKIKGVLEVYQRAPLRADPEWLNFIQMLAGQAAIAIDNAQLFEELQRTHSGLVLSYDATIEGWSRALDLRDQETEGHSERVAELTEQLARAVGVNEIELINIRRGALLHDIGKIGVPDHILRKPESLTDEEWKIMRRHPEFALDLLKPIPYLHSALDIPYCHHEKWDGTGYPRGLAGEAIPLTARIFALVDVWDALRSERPYRAAWSEEQAREYIRQQVGKHFDPKLLERFLKIVR